MNPLYLINQAKQIMAQVQNPQQLLQRFLPDVPQEIRNDPNQIIGWLQQTGKVSPDMIRTVQQMMGR